METGEQNLIQYDWLHTFVCVVGIWEYMLLFVCAP